MTSVQQELEQAAHSHTEGCNALGQGCTLRHRRWQEREMLPEKWQKHRSFLISPLFLGGEHLAVSAGSNKF